MCVDREEITDYLKWRNEDYVTDSTNLTNDYTRNKIRLEVIPGLAEINPSVKESIAATADRIREAELIYRQAIEEAVKRVKKGDVIDIGALVKEIAPQTVLHEILAPLGFNSSQTGDIMEVIGNGNSGKQFYAADWYVTKDRNRLIITALGLERNVETILPQEGVVNTAEGYISVCHRSFDGVIPKEKNCAILDCAKLELPLKLRRVEPGDRFAPFGMRGTKLVSDYLTDRKKSIIEKHAQLVVTDASGRIAWLVNERPAATFCVEKNTEEVIVLRLIKD